MFSSLSWKQLLLDNLLFELASPVRNRVLLGLSVFICVFLLLFRPFDLDSAPVIELGFTAIGSAVTFFVVGWGLNSLRATGYWPLKDRPLLAEILYMACFIGIVGVLVYLLRLNSEYVEFSLASALEFQLYAFLVAIVIVFISRLLTALVKLQRASQTRGELQKSLAAETDELVISLPLTSGEENFSFPLSKWIGAKAAGNYLELYFNTANHKPTVLVRSTLKLLSKAMRKDSRFYHCHRSYAINLEYVESLRGRSQAYKLTMRGLTEQVPVSRSAEKDLLTRLR